jgi:hypothetical protein
VSSAVHGIERKIARRVRVGDGGALKGEIQVNIGAQGIAGRSIRWIECKLPKSDRGVGDHDPERCRRDRRGKYQVALDVRVSHDVRPINRRPSAPHQILNTKLDEGIGIIHSHEHLRAPDLNRERKIDPTVVKRPALTLPMTVISGVAVARVGGEAVAGHRRGSDRLVFREVHSLWDDLRRGDPRHAETSPGARVVGNGRIFDLQRAVPA